MPLQIATLMTVHFGMSGVKPHVEIRFQQLTILTYKQYLSTVGWTVAAIVLAAVSIIMAFSAAVQVIEPTDLPFPGRSTFSFQTRNKRMKIQYSASFNFQCFRK